MQGMVELVWFSQSKNQEASGKSKGRRARLKFIRHILCKSKMLVKMQGKLRPFLMPTGYKMDHVAEKYQDFPTQG